jgi:hypothetical protein
MFSLCSRMLILKLEAAFSITITPTTGYRRLTVTGDVAASLEPPMMLTDDSYRIALSDGTLLKAHDDGRISVEVEGAAILLPNPDGSLTVDWRIDWVALAAPSDFGLSAARLPGSLPLFAI